MDEDAAIWDDLEEDDEDVWDDPQEEGPVAYLTFSVESREDRFTKQGVRREDYPTQRAYDAACDLIDLQNGKGYVPSDSTRQWEIERRQFLVEGGCVAARSQMCIRASTRGDQRNKVIVCYKEFDPGKTQRNCVAQRLKPKLQ